MINIGATVRMSEQLKTALRANDSAEHVDEFGECVGTVEPCTDFDGDFVNVRWQPSGLRYLYAPSDLVTAG